MRILFQGDSITDCGRDRNDFHGLGNGYVKKIKDFNAGLEVLNRGISGDRVADLKARWDEDCIKLKPDVLSVLIGVNDAWRIIDSGAECDYENFHIKYHSILTYTKKELPKTKIVILEPFLFKIGAGNLEFRKLLDKNIDIIRDIAREFADVYIPLDGILQSYRIHHNDEKLIPDGVHPSDLGHSILATEVIETLRKGKLLPLKK